MSLSRCLTQLRMHTECVVLDSRTLRLTYLSPSSLIAHLPQATLTIGSISQLSQLLFDEVGSCLLECICEVASELCESVHGTWFVDLLTNRTIGRWEGRALYVPVCRFQVHSSDTSPQKLSCQFRSRFLRSVYGYFLGKGRPTSGHAHRDLHGQSKRGALFTELGSTDG